MILNFSSKQKSHPVYIWDAVSPGAWGDPFETIEAVADAWRNYKRADIDERICEHEDMLGRDAGALDDYRRTGVTALRILSEAMVATGRVEFPDVLDLPCGGGRVTRHLRAFLPASRLHVGDVDVDKLNSVAEQFGAQKFSFPRDFRGDSAQTFDLIFSGSLLTHFDKDLFERAVDFFVRSLKPAGLALLTLHGRSSASASLNPASVAEAKRVAAEFREHMKQKNAFYKVQLDIEKAVLDGFRTKGFGYFLSPAWTFLYNQSYGGSYSAPSWIMNLLERRSDCIIVGFKERSYGNIQDVVIVQRV